MSTTAPVRIGIIGAANIARQFTHAIAGSPLIRVEAAASRDAAKAKAFAAECGIARWHASYEALLADPSIEAVYNPLPNGLHAEWSIRAADAGKHVLCEKPLCVDGAEARAMFAAAERNKVHLVEAYPYLSQPMTLQVRELVGGGAIGKLQLIRSAFGFPTPKAPNIRLDSDLAGGSLMDAGSYAVSFVRAIGGERPTRVTAIARWGQSGIDLTMTALIEHPSGMIAEVASSMQTAYNRHAQVIGDQGTIDTQYLNHPPAGGPPTITVRRGPTAAVDAEMIAVPTGNGFLAEAESFARMVRQGASHWNGATKSESIDIADTLAAILKSARSGAPVTL